MTLVEPFEIGDKVVWQDDDDHGVVTGLTDNAVEIQWYGASMREWYSLYSGAVLFNILPVTRRFSCHCKR